MNQTKNTYNTWHEKHESTLTSGQRFANKVAKFMGSWKFLLIQTIFIVVWVGLNLVGYLNNWDPYPFIMLNLVFSAQATYAAPIILMAQNRQASRDRAQAQADFETDLEAKREIENIQTELKRVENEKLDKVISLLESLKGKL